MKNTADSFELTVLPAHAGLGNQQVATLRKSRWRPGRARVVACSMAFAALMSAPLPLAAHGADHPPPLRNGRNQFTVFSAPEPVPMAPILSEEGNLVDLGRFRGKTVLLNFWATWCPPCVDELPSLDRLKSTLRADAFEVVALSVDDESIQKPFSFANRLGLQSLAIYLDFTGAMKNRLPLYGLPISYLIDQEGLVVGYIVGAVKWDSPEALRFLDHYTAQESFGTPIQRRGSGE